MEFDTLLKCILDFVLEGRHFLDSAPVNDAYICTLAPGTASGINSRV